MNILITGGTGLVGSALSRSLSNRGHVVSILTRNLKDNLQYKQYLWNPIETQIDDSAFENLDCIIHLAGAGIADKRWTKNRKEELLSSRVDTVNFLFQKLKELNLPLKSFISSSAIGWYGVETTDDIYTEEAKASTHFLGHLCECWEHASDAFHTLGCKVSKVRTGVVLSKDGGALTKFIKPILWGQGAPLGSGKQYIPWIHIDDLCEIYIQLAEGVIPSGIYNGVAPDHITNGEFTQLLAKSLKKTLWLPNIPSWAVYMLLGKMSSMLLNGSRVSSTKLIDNSFEFKYPSISKAVASIIH